MEIWKDIPSCCGYYQASTEGRIRSVSRYASRLGKPVYLKGKVLTPRANKGYFSVTISINSDSNKKLVSRLVAETFIPNPENKPQVNHIDENKENNRPSNLQWVTAKENSNWGTRNERIADYQRNNSKGKGLNTNDGRFKPVYRMDVNTGEILEKYNSVKDAIKSMGAKSNVGALSSCLTGNGNSKTFKGYKWKYADDNS